MYLRLMLMKVTVIFLVGLSSAGQAMAQAGKEITNSIGMKLVLIPNGKFVMGSAQDEVGRWDGEIQHEVTISQDYYLGVYEVTQAQYEQVMKHNPSYFVGDKIEGDSSNHPVEEITWEDAIKFCNRMSGLPEERAAGHVYRLPTEAEWEFACRAGSQTAYSFGDDQKQMGDYGWFFDNSGLQTHSVGQKKPNAWGLYDMHGNVCEWCADGYGDYPQAAVTDPPGPASSWYRVCRGGGWDYDAIYCRSADRSFSFHSARSPFRHGAEINYRPSDRTSGNGFRVAVSSSGIRP